MDVIDAISNLYTPLITLLNKRPCQCGQFAELMVPNVGEGPFAPSSPCYKPETLTFTIQNVGYMTSVLHQMKEGDKVGVRGPYGNGFPLNEFYGKEILLLIGGVGFPPARTLLYSLLHEKNKFPRILMCYGARSPEDIVYKYQINEFHKKIDLYPFLDNFKIRQLAEVDPDHR